MEWIVSMFSALGINGILLFLFKRYFNRKDRKDEEERKKRDEIYSRLDAALETIRLLSYARMSQETERLLNQKYATPTERRVLNEMYKNYKSHNWNGDMDERLHKVYSLPTAPNSSQDRDVRK